MDYESINFRPKVRYKIAIGSGPAPKGGEAKAVWTLKTEYAASGLPDNDTSVIRGPVRKKTGWPRGQWSGANPPPECLPFSGVPGANRETIQNLFQMPFRGDGYILDGHTRYRILKKHTFIQFDVEEILSGRIKATDEQIVALASIPKEERPELLEELRKKKDKRDKALLSRLKPAKPPKVTPKKITSDPLPEQPTEELQPSVKSPPKEEIEPTSNAPPDFLESIQGRKRQLTDEDKARLKVSVDNRYHDKVAADGSIVLCELQGATEDFIARWKIIFRDGRYYVFDGQNTVEARRTCNGGKNLPIRCKVFYGLTKEDEATLFAIQTGISTYLTAGERLRANLVAGNPDALYFVGVTSNAGVELIGAWP